MRNSFDERHNKRSNYLSGYTTILKPDSPGFTDYVDVREWHKLNQKELLEHYSYNQYVQKVEFIKNRFELFAKRVNKKMEAFTGYKAIHNNHQAFARYFEIQKRYLINQEKYGYDESY